MDETLGVEPATGYDGPTYSTQWDCFREATGWTTRVSSPYGQLAADPWLDFDCNGQRGTAVFSDVSQFSEVNHHVGYDDWDHLIFAFQIPATLGVEDNFSRQGAVGEAGAVFEPELSIEQALAGGYLYPPLVPERAEVYPGCAQPKIPLSGAYLVPLVVYGQDGDNRTDLPDIELAFASALSMSWYDFDGDTLDDLVAWFDVDDLDLSSGAIAVSFSGRQDSSRLVAGNIGIVGRVANPNDTDLDGIQNACDSCMHQGTSVGPDGCPL